MNNLKIPGIPITNHFVSRGVTSALALASKPRPYLLSLICVGFLTAAVTGIGERADCSAATGAERGTLYEQESKLLGKCDLLISKSGIRMDMKKKDLVLISAPPSWDIIIYNRGEHKYFRSSPGHFHPPTACTVALYRPGDTSTMRSSTAEDTTVLGVKARKVHMLGDSNKGKESRTWERLLINSGDYWLQPTTKAPPHVLRGIQQMYALPYGEGVPLQLVTVSNKGKVSKELTLVKISEQPVFASRLQIPAGYAAVKKQEDLLMDRNTDDFIELFPGYR